MSFDLKLAGGDINPSPDNGDLETVEDGEKLTQDILKIISTQIGANRKFPWYGCPITQALIGTAYDSVFISSMATSQLKFSVTNVQRLQKEQLRRNQLVTAQEQIAAVQNVSIEQNNVDPRFYAVTLDVLSKAFRRSRISFNISL